MTAHDSSPRRSDVSAREQEFHDEWARSIDPRQVLVHESFTVSTAPEARWILQQLGDLTGKSILDLGSGAGEAAVHFATAGANVVATDISGGMLQVARAVAGLHETRIRVVVCSAEELPFAADSFDIVYAANLLHHVTLDRCLDEVRRVLKLGGTAAFWDPSGVHNPVINVYRRMAKAVRTEDEHPISRKDMRRFSTRFGDVRTRHFWLLSLLVFAKYYFVDGVHPSADRYWKRILMHEDDIRWLYKPLTILDGVILRIAPCLRWLCWNVAIVARK